MLERIKREPALVAGLVAASLALLAAFGLPLTSEQVGAVLALTNAILALLVRRVVAPIRKRRRGKHAA